MAKKIQVKENYGTTVFTVKEKYKTIVKDAIHTVHKDEYDISNFENYWSIYFYIEDLQQVHAYRIDTSFNFLSKYHKFEKMVKKILNKDVCNFKDIIGLMLNIEVKKTYILNKTDNKWCYDSVIEKMSLIEEKKLS